MVCGAILIVALPDAAAGIVAATAALIIAFVAYPWQKARDRELKQHSEKLAAYQRFVSEITKHHSLVATTWYNDGNKAVQNDEAWKPIIAAYPGVVSSSYDLIFYAPADVIEACQEYLEAVLAYEVMVLGPLGLEKQERSAKKYTGDLGTFKAAQRARRRAILAIRKDISDEAPEVSEEAINAFFVLTPAENG
ncbi:hypothetical protein BMG03_17020 [Thioclava nitratireducens]|uniref:Uncharacterized protein n=1 Tax=Thioclava nitratireducens TaxID=1915078 RepID=A0ABN4XIR0_9RHOB|nr:hypothetical protein BMG03_17020 [Thioclava nitratireducens]